DADNALDMVESKGRGDGRAPVAALGGETLIAKLRHQSSPECCHLEGIHTALPGTVRESIARQRGDDHIKGVLSPSTVRLGIGQERDKLHHLDEASRPSMRDDQRHWPWTLAADMHKVEMESLDSDPILRELVQHGLLPAPVVDVSPIMGQRFHGAET